MPTSLDWLDWRTRIRTAAQSAFAPMLGRRASPPWRRFHAYAAGLPRSGTHSLAAMFEGRFLATHGSLVPGTSNNDLLRSFKNTAGINSIQR